MKVNTGYGKLIVLVWYNGKVLVMASICRLEKKYSIKRIMGKKNQYK